MTYIFNPSVPIFLAVNISLKAALVRGANSTQDLHLKFMETGVKIDIEMRSSRK